MRYSFIQEHRSQWPIRTMCQVLRVHPGGYYRWRDAVRDPPRRQLRRLALIESIRTIHRRSHGTYGAPRVHRQLRSQGQHCSRRTVETLMRQQQIRSKRIRRFRLRTTDPNHPHPIAANLLRGRFCRPRMKPNQIWMADITFVPTAEGWLYLAVVMDLYSRRIVGWEGADHLRTALTVAALQKALEQRRPAKGLMHHSDRGVQYACGQYQSLLVQHGMRCSMSRRGDCYDNAVIESFFKTFKSELVNHQQYQTRKQAIASIHAWIELFYNRQRRHSALGYQSPAGYEGELC
jgi:transposase InsO family protein